MFSTYRKISVVPVQRSIVQLSANLYLVLLLTACVDGLPTGVDLEHGRVTFENYCSACHQVDGQGTEGGVPPLDESQWVSGPESRTIRIILHGLWGEIQVLDKTYNREMPAFGPVLSNTDIASLLSFVRQQYGGSKPPVSPETVRQIRSLSGDRTNYWSVEELLQFP